jgi:preprotein translocase subunit SecF
MLDFVGKRWAYLTVGTILFIISVVILAIPPFLKPGIEFTSGSSFTLEFVPVTKADGTIVQPSVTHEALNDKMHELGHDEARVQRAGGDYTFLVRTRELQGAPPIGDAEGPLAPGEIDTLQQSICNAFGVTENNVCSGVNRRDFSTVSGTVSTEIARNSAIAVAVAALFILLYISMSFRKLPNARRYGACAVVAVLHDAVIVLAVFSLLGKLRGTEVDTAFITAILTVIGFSVHDTIVVFDRIREKLVHDAYIPFEEAVNASLTETLARSLNTSLVVVLTVVAMLLIGGPTIRNFLLVLLIGIVAGTYSSIGIASQLLVAWHNHDVSKFFKKLRGGESSSTSAEPIRS